MQSFKRDAKLVEWSTKIIAQTVAGTTGKEGKEFQKSVSKIKMTFDDDTDLPDMSDSDTLYNEAPGAEEDFSFIEEGAPNAENNIGSTEALFGGFGR